MHCMTRLQTFTNQRNCATGRVSSRRFSERRGLQTTSFGMTRIFGVYESRLSPSGDSVNATPEEIQRQMLAAIKDFKTAGLSFLEVANSSPETLAAWLQSFEDEAGGSEAFARVLGFERGHHTLGRPS